MKRWLANNNWNDRKELRYYRCRQKGHFKRDCLAENININMIKVEKSKPIILKMILKKPKVGDEAPDELLEQ